RRARCAHARVDERRAATHLARPPQDRGVRDALDQRSGVPRRPRHGDDAAPRPHRRHADHRPAAAAHARCDDDGSVRHLRAPHPQRIERRRRAGMKSSVGSFTLRLLLIAVVLLVWEGLVRFFAVPAFILPEPSNIFMALYRGIASRLYIDHIGVTLAETLIGFALGTSLAFLLGTAVALSRRTEYFLYPFIVMFQAMPKVALAPLIIVWFGLGLTSKVVTAALVAFFPLLVNTIVGLRSAEEDRINLMRSLAASRWQLFWMLQLPNAMPYIFAGLEIAMIFALLGAIVAELVGAQSGLGMLIQSMNFTMDVAGQFSVLLILSLVGLLLNGIVTTIRKRILFWDVSQKMEIEGAKVKKGG